MACFTEYVSPIGKLYLTAEAGFLTGISMDPEAPAGADWGSENSVLILTMEALDAYFRGEIPMVERIPMKMEGSDFAKQVWKILMRIPYGQVRTYGSIAREMAAIAGKQKMSAQAVGQAVGHNPIAILIPCHRVVGAKGKLTGYAWGLEKKKWLLNHEKWNGEIKE